MGLLTEPRDLSERGGTLFLGHPLLGEELLPRQAAEKELVAKHSLALLVGGLRRCRQQLGNLACAT